MEEKFARDEKLLYKTKISRRSLLTRYSISIALIICGIIIYFNHFVEYAYIMLLIVGIAIFLISEILLYTHRLYVTNHAVTERKGIISRKVKAVDLEDVIDIAVSQNVKERFLNYGEIHINTPEDKKNDEIVFPKIANPMKIKKIIEDAMRRRAYLITNAHGQEHRKE